MTQKGKKKTPIVKKPAKARLKQQEKYLRTIVEPAKRLAAWLEELDKEDAITSHSQSA